MGRRNSLRAGQGNLGATVPVARVQNVTAAAQTVATGTLTPLTFDTAIFDTDNMWSGANPSRLTCRTSGLFLIIGSFGWDTASIVGTRGCVIRVNGTTDISYSDFTWINTNDASPATNPTSIYRLAVGDFVELMAFQTSGLTRTIVKSASALPVFMMTRISA